MHSGAHAFTACDNKCLHTNDIDPIGTVLIPDLTRAFLNVYDRNLTYVVLADTTNGREVVRGKNLTLRPDQQQGGLVVIWDPSTYTFPLGSPNHNEVDARNVTVAEYFHERYGIRLNFPRMPLIHTKIRGRSNWIPIEFLWQSFGKAKDANGPENVRAVLAEKDEAAGPRLINQLLTVYASVLPEINAYLQSCNIQIDNEPLTLQARVLRNPRISFEGGVSGSINNGSWDMKQAFSVAMPKNARAKAVSSVRPPSLSFRAKTTTESNSFPRTTPRAYEDEEIEHRLMSTRAQLSTTRLWKASKISPLRTTMKVLLAVLALIYPFLPELSLAIMTFCSRLRED